MTTPLQDTTEETLAAIAKAQTTGILESTGAYSYDLTGLVRLIPVVTPFRTKVSRKASPNGNPFAVWRAFLNKNQSQPRPTPGFDYASAEVLFAEQDFQARYMPIGLAGLVTQDAFDVARGLYDPYAEATMQVLNQVLIAEDKALIGGQSYILAQPDAPTMQTANTGGSMTAGATTYVGVAARTGMGYFYGGNSQGNSNSITTGTAVAGSTHTVTASIAAVKGAVAYDWFQSANGSTWYYYTTTTIASVVMTATIGSNNPVPALPAMSTELPTFDDSVDNGSGNAAEFDGFIASLTGDYSTTGNFVTAGTDNANGAVWTDGGGAALSLTGGTITQFTAMFLALWNQVYCSPTAVMINAIQAQEIANLVLAQPSAVTYLNTDASGRVDTVAGGRVGHVVNTPAGGITVPLEVHPHVPPGTVLFRTDRVPFPQANISSTLEVRTLRDMSQFDYATNRVADTLGGGPRKEFEIRSVEAFVNRAPVAMGALVNIS